MESILFSDEYFMKQALLEAQKAFSIGEIPVGCVVVSNNQIIGKGHNLTERLNDVTAHAEMQAITAAANFLGAKYLPDCTIYITLEPCIMCAGAIFWAQFNRVVYAASDDKRGFQKALVNLHPKTKIEKGILADEASDLMKQFFKNLR
jgi:tRNA(adenine34) deaminase